MDGVDGKKILVTGGCGTIGRAIIKQLMEQHPYVIRIVDNDEADLFTLQQDFEGDNLRFLLGDLQNYDRLEMALEDIDIVFHCAALKHVAMCEYSPFEAVRTNVIGTQNLIKAALANNVDKLVYTSSDKAVNPTNVMGTTKLLGEQLITAANNYSGSKRTKFSSVRFGNVLGSTGSIIPLWTEQIKRSRKVTITDERMTRFVMSETEASSLVIRASGIMMGGETFILKMPTVRITELADIVIGNVARTVGLAPTDITKEMVGIKPGEKLYEELVTDTESERSFDSGEMYVIIPESRGFSNIDYSKWMQLPRIASATYNSRDSQHLNGEQILSLLGTAGLLEVDP